MAGKAVKSNRICLLAVDGSKHSTLALKWYKDNVYKAGDRVLLAHCVDFGKHMNFSTLTLEPETRGTDSIAHKYKEEEKKAKELLDKFHTECKKLGLEDVELVRVIGEPGSGIVQTAVQRHADLIVTGCRGLGQIRRTIVGSVSDYILHHSDVPVFICKH